MRRHRNSALEQSFRASLYAGVVGLVLIVSWARAVVEHRKIHRLFQAGQMGDVERGSALDTLLQSAFRSTTQGLHQTIGMGLFVILALV